MKRIYIAHPLGIRRGNDKTEQKLNVQKSIEVTRALLQKGWTPFNPLLYWFVHDGWEETISEEEWLVICASWIPFCDALLNMDKTGESSGCLFEERLARVLGKTIYRNITEVPYLEFEN